MDLKCCKHDLILQGKTCFFRHDSEHGMEYLRNIIRNRILLNRMPNLQWSGHSRGPRKSTVKPFNNFFWRPSDRRTAANLKKNEVIAPVLKAVENFID